MSFFLPLYVLRLYIYGSLSWHWFLVDFCYFSNFACVWGIVGAPASTTLLVMNFAHTSGPLALAIPIWRNSLVFHSLDKVTSVFVHALPGLLTFLLRWVPATRPEGLHVPERLELGPTAGSNCPSLGSAPARLLRLLRARLAAPGSSALPGEEAGPPGAQPLPRVLELAASKVADSAAFNDVGPTLGLALAGYAAWQVIVVVGAVLGVRVGASPNRVACEDTHYV